ncbi:hypothetical protein AP053_gp135 [Ostreococcus mediterraneus virus 1]|uniref:hypothetical protein n=1 Tax=Ostreococcus mediterraneus virus 1 TaxID=1663210 RepID=UPI0006D05C42|nr:hypothetical protein AP053_gp135 [Ostreococcus mediterraneus virus 1]ALI95246.1 hypothetical protein OmV1_135c [Ostreococcus mediterraneus virus 1]
MDHRPTSFLVLDNKELGTFWVGQTNIKPGANDHAIGRDKLIDKLSSKYEEEYPHLCFNVESIACEIYKFHEIENWVTSLLYEINRKPTKLGELQQLLTAGWTEWDYTTNSTIHVLRVSKTQEGLRNTYKRLICDWEAKGLRCLNTLRCKTDKEKYEHKKKDPNFMYNKARKEVLRKIKKTGKMPKQSTIDKYELKNVDIKEIMEEEAPCQPCEKEFYKRGKYWYCLCDKRSDRCSNPDCKALGAELGLRVGGSICEHGTIRSTCKTCGGGEVCEHSKIRSRCKPCGGGYICEHNKYRSQCKPCGGVSICEHNINRTGCRKCRGSQVCEHNRTRSACKECKGGSICEHNRERSSCKVCNPQSYIAHLRRARRRRVCVKTENPTHTLDDLCMTSEEWLKYLHKTFEDRYGRPKTEKDEVHIDEIIPCSAWNLPDDNKYCWHYLNSQWLLAEDNLSKSDSYEEEDKLTMIERIQSSTYISSSEIG